MKMLTEVDIPDLVVLHYFTGNTLGDDLALVNYVGASANTERFPNVMIGYQNTYILPAQVFDNTLNIQH